MNFLIFVRHGETEWNREKRFQGGSSDVPLSPFGRLQGQDIARVFLRDKIAMLLSSPMVRAKETAEMIASENRVQVQVVEQLRELNFGVYEGKLESELERDFGEEYRKWRESNYTLAPPGGESLADARDRAKAVIDIAFPYLTKGSVIICAHQGINMAIKAFITGDYSTVSTQQFRQPNNRIDYWSLDDKRQVRVSEVYSSFAGRIPVFGKPSSIFHSP